MRPNQLVNFHSVYVTSFSLIVTHCRDEFQPCYSFLSYILYKYHNSFTFRYFNRPILVTAQRYNTESHFMGSSTADRHYILQAALGLVWQLSATTAYSFHFMLKSAELATISVKYIVLRHAYAFKICVTSILFPATDTSKKKSRLTLAWKCVSLLSNQQVHCALRTFSS